MAPEKEMPHQEIISNPANSKEVLPAKNPLDILKNRFSFLPPLDIKSPDWHEKKMGEYKEQSEKLKGREGNLAWGSRDMKQAIHLRNEATFNHFKEELLMQSVLYSEEDEYGREIAKARAMSYKKRADRAAFLVQAENYQVGSPEREKEETMAKSEEYISTALDFTIFQVECLTRAENYSARSPEREKEETMARDSELLAEEYLSRAWKDYVE
jgi:hypothetical protein